MTIEQIKLAAYNWKDLPPPDMDLPERCLWLMLANIYRRFRDGEITKEQGETLKQNAVSQYQVDRTRYDTQKAMIQEQAAMWARIEIASHKYGIERTIEAADAFVEAVYNVKLKPAETKT